MFDLENEAEEGAGGGREVAQAELEASNARADAQDAADVASAIWRYIKVPLKHRIGYRLGGVAAALVVILAGAAGVARAATATWYVAPTGSNLNSCATSAQPCATINGAIGKAAAGDTVRVAAGTYTGSGDEVVLVDRALTLEGGWNATFTSQDDISTVDGESARRGVHVAGAAVRIERFLIENGTATFPFADGGGILVGGPGGGAIGAGLTLDESTVRNSRPGGIWSEGALSVTGSTISGNSSDNTGNGGGITIFGDAPLDVRNSTVSGNSAPEGGGILLRPIVSATVQLSNVTIVDNSAQIGGGVRLATFHATARVRNSIVAENTATLSGADFAGDTPSAVHSDGYNIGTGFAAAAGDMLNEDPGVDDLADNGGPTETRALLFDSPAVDAGNPAGCADENGAALDTDQRGAPRPLLGACDIGAYEAQPPENDNFAEAESLDGVASPVFGSNEFATRETGEPRHADAVGGASVWYTWTAPFTGTAFVSTAGSTYDTLVGVYTGGSVSSLTTLAGNDDVALDVRTSKTCFAAAAGTLYRIAVDGYDALDFPADSVGRFSLAWGQYTTDSPCSVRPPTIAGTPQVGRPLSASTGIWAGAPSGFTYQWLTCHPAGCSTIRGATGQTFTPPPGSEGAVLSVRVTAKHPSDPAQDAIAYSANAAPVAPAPPTHALTVTNAGSGSGTAASSPAGISCGATCSGSFEEGAVVTLTATAAAGSIFTGWSGACSGAGACQVTMATDRTVTATFALIMHTLSVTAAGPGSGTTTSAPAGISCAAACSAPFAEGTVVTLTATPAAGSAFTGWSGVCSGAGACQVTMATDQTLTATFAPIMHTLSVTRSGSGSGTTTSAPAGISCSSTCSALFAEGTVVTLTATAATGSTFTGWSGGCSGSGACQVTMGADATVTATFARRVSCLVPKVRGKSLASAKRLISTRHCAVGRVTRAKSKSVSKGKVISQSPKPGTKRPARSKVNLVVSRGRR